MSVDFKGLSYSSPEDPALRRWIIQLVEQLSGRPKLLTILDRWKDIAARDPDRSMRNLLDLLEVAIDVRTGSWPPTLEGRERIIMIANHPFGIGDGITLLAMAEELGRPYRALMDSRLARIPQITKLALPIDFTETENAVQTNERSKSLARELLQQSHTIIIFPSGGVATARWPFGKSHELPWKHFTARLVQSTEASIVPIFIEGQNGPLFQLVSQISQTLRLAVEISEFIRGFPSSTIRVHVGEIVPYGCLGNTQNEEMLTQELFQLVHGLWRA